jgi:hypothetical protein
MWLKNPAFHVDFKNLHLPVVKTVRKKGLPKESEFSGQIFIWQKSLFANPLFGALFTKIKKNIFDILFAIFEEKKFSSLLRENYYFLRT